MSDVEQDVAAFIDRWRESGGAEIANTQSFLNELCDLLGVDKPEPTLPEEHLNAYTYEKAVKAQDAGMKRIDLYKRGCFVLEAKQGAGSAGVSPAIGSSEPSSGDATLSPEGRNPGETPALPETLPGWHSRGYLPHFDDGKRPQAITFRLADSLPAELLANWEKELAELGEDARAIERRKRIEAALDAGSGACHMNQPEVAKLVQDALLHFDGERYRLHAWVVMPNHVHVLISPVAGYALCDIVHAWKSFTAKEANRMLGLSGTFWQREYHDRWIRDQAHFNHVVQYIAGNPVKAGLKDWPWLGGPGSAGVSPASTRSGGAVREVAAASQSRRDAGAPRKLPAWPKTLPEQVAALRDLLATLPAPETQTPETLASHFKGTTKKKLEQVEQVLETLWMLGL